MQPLIWMFPKLNFFIYIMTDYIYVKLVHTGQEIYVKHDRDKLLKKYPDLQRRLGGRDPPDEIHNGLSCFYVNDMRLFNTEIYIYNPVLDEYKKVYRFSIDEELLTYKGLYGGIECYNCDLYKHFIKEYGLPCDFYTEEERNSADEKFFKIKYADRVDRNFDTYLHTLYHIRRRRIYHNYFNTATLYRLNEQIIDFSIFKYKKFFEICSYQCIDFYCEYIILKSNAKLQKVGYLELVGDYEFEYEELNIVQVNFLNYKTFIKCKILICDSPVNYSTDILVTDKHDNVNNTVKTLITHNTPPSSLLEAFPSLEVVVMSGEDCREYIRQEIKKC